MTSSSLTVRPTKICKSKGYKRFSKRNSLILAAVPFTGFFGGNRFYVKDNCNSI